MDGRTLVGYSFWGLKESDITELPSTHTHTELSQTEKEYSMDIHVFNFFELKILL